MPRELIQLPSGLNLEISLSQPSLDPANPAAVKLAICLHPWSWLGGRMSDPVLLDVRDVLLSRGYHVLRYSSRGVGKSSGWPSLTGLQEAKDLQELIHWALEKMPSITSLVVLGYSHGALIASLCPLLEESRNIPISHVILSYPLGPRSLITAFKGTHYATTLTQLLRNPRSRALIVYSDRDEFTSVDKYDAWAETLSRDAERAGQLDIVKLVGNHFWHNPDGRRSMLDEIATWCL